MIRKDKKKLKGNITKTWIRVVEGYRPGPGLPPKQRTIKSFGYLEDQENPEEFMEQVTAFDETFRTDRVLRIEVPSNAKMYSPYNRSYNYGYKYLEAIYDQLEISEWIGEFEKEKGFKGKYPLKDIFKFLTIARILVPDSKRATAQLKNEFYGMHTEFTLEHLYHALDHYANMEIELQRSLNEKVKELIGRDLSYAFYDCTNYFFEIDHSDAEDGLRKKGVSKEHRVDPIVGMGLFMDRNGLPISMSLFPGNTSETITLKPAMEDVKASYGLGRLIVVADKALNSSKNLSKIIANGDGYVVSQILKGKKGQRYHEALFDPDGYIAKSADYKYKVFEEEYRCKDEDGEDRTHIRKVLIYWNRKDAEMARKKREEKLSKAKKKTENNAYSIKKGSDAYTKEEVVDKESGECLQNTKKILTVDQEKAEKDALYDGYFCIVTSELEYGEPEIKKTYGGLWKIEQSFRIIKSDLDGRPAFVRTKKHITAHFLICFVALLIIRILQHRMEHNALSVERIKRALNLATCEVLKGGIIHLHDVGGAIAFQKKQDKSGNWVDTLQYSDQDEIALDYKRIQDTYGTDFYDIYPRQEVFNKFLGSLK